LLASKNAYKPILVKVLGRLMLVSPVAPAKVWLEMVVTPLGITMLVSPLAF
jgi:hypothetical protein